MPEINTTKVLQDTFVQKTFCSYKKTSSDDYNGRGPVPSLDILRGRKINQLPI
jgi:hypothetical protein